MKNTHDKRILELVGQDDKLEGGRVLSLLYSLAESLQILRGNYSELFKAMEDFEREIDVPTDMLTLDVDKYQRLNGFLIDFSRLLHNYLSSVYSLKEHTNFFRKRKYLPDRLCGFG